jgi:hypothetical protein
MILSVPVFCERQKKNTGFYDLRGKFVENRGSYTMEITDLVTFSWTECVTGKVYK